MIKRPNILFVHQNFPAQFLHLAPEMVKQGYSVYVLCMHSTKPIVIPGVKIVTYSPLRGSSANIHPWVIDFEAKIIRGEACFLAANALKKQNFYPQIILAHPGWGEALFLKEVWPSAILIDYCEYYYHLNNSDLHFDREFTKAEPVDECRIKIKNINNQINLRDADFGISPTYYQRNTYPENLKSKIQVIHDGIDTKRVTSNPNIKIKINNKITLDKKSKVLTFVSRNLEPFRGYHSLMRTLPNLLKRYEDLYVLIVGGKGVSYGTRPPENQSWKDIFLREIANQMDEKELSRVHFLGNLVYSDYLKIIQISSVHLYLSYPFVVSWSLLEAMSAEAAIVANRTEAIDEFIVDQKTGLSTDFFNYLEISQKISYLIDNEAERLRLGRNARQTIIERYDLATICLPKQVKFLHTLCP